MNCDGFTNDGFTNDGFTNVGFVEGHGDVGTVEATRCRGCVGELFTKPGSGFGGEQDQQGRDGVQDDPGR